MPTSIHEMFIASVEYRIYTQLDLICAMSDGAALFAQNVRLGRSTEIYFPVDNAPPGTESKHEPDASFWHDEAQYPGVILEVSYSQKRKRLAQLAEVYLLDSDTSVQAVVGLDIEYGKKGSRTATLSVWRTHVVHTVNGNEFGVVQEIADEVCYVLRQYFLGVWFLIFLHRRSVTIKETLRIIEVCDFNCPTLLVKSSQRTQ